MNKTLKLVLYAIFLIILLFTMFRCSQQIIDEKNISSDMASDERAKTTQADATNEADQALGAVTDALPSVTETAGDSIGGVAADAGSDDSVNQAADAVSASVAEAAADAG